jgi:hypothetical protein
VKPPDTNNGREAQMSKGSLLFLGMGALWAFGLGGCQSEGKIPFDDDELAPGNTSGQGGSSGSGGSGSSGRGGAGGSSGGASGFGGKGGSSGSSGSGGSSGFGGSSAGTGGSSAGRGGSSGSLGSGGNPPFDPDEVGQNCSDESDCEAIPRGYCANAGMCTTTCKTHVDCGCPIGTVNNDIAAGECSAACVTYDDGGSYCQRVCSSSSQCDGESRCEELDFYGVCSPYST